MENNWALQIFWGGFWRVVRNVAIAFMELELFHFPVIPENFGAIVEKFIWNLSLRYIIAF